MKPLCKLGSALARICALALVAALAACVADDPVNFPTPTGTGGGMGVVTASDV